MEYGPDIEVNGKRPAWIADDDVIRAYNFHDEAWYGDQNDTPDMWYWPLVTKIRLPAGHWANDVIEKGYWPWAGGNKAPDDWDGGEVLCRGGQTISAVDVDRWFHTSGLGDIIGYKREVEVVSEPDTNSMVGFNQIIRDLKAQLDSLGSKWADAIAKYPDLAPDPYLKRARELVESEAMKVGAQYYDDDADSLVIRAIIRALKEGMPTPVSKPCKLTPEELAQWRLEQARRIGAGALDIRSLQDIAKPIRDGNGDFYAPVQSTLAALTEYNITPETVK